jgi:rRNA maturation endonuclease Nob1
MASTLDASCSCGYSGSAMYAFGRRDQGKIFYYPHACTDCKKVVSVNILQTPNTCAECGSNNIFRYGVLLKHPLSIGRWARIKTWLNGEAARYEKEKSELRSTRLYGEAFCEQHRATYAIKPKPAFCPSCGEETLVFDYGVLAD